MNELPIINLNSVSSESISTLSEANKRALHNSIEQSFLAKNISIKPDSISMDIEINGRWQTVRLAIEPQSQKLELPEAQVTLDETGLKLTLQTPKYGIQIKAADQLLTLMNFLKGDSIGANITTHAEAKLSPASLQLPKLDINLAINPSLAKMLSAEPKLIAQLHANTSKLSLTVNDRFDEQLLQQPISKHKIAQSLVNNTPSILLNLSEKTPKVQHPLTKAELPLINAEKLPSQSKANIWRTATPVATISGLEISEKPKQYAIQLKHSAKSMLAHTSKLNTTDSSTPLKSNLSYDKPLLEVSFNDVKQAVRAAIQKIIQVPFMFTNNRNIKDASPTQLNNPLPANKLPSLNIVKDSLPFIYPEAKNSKADPIVQLFSQIKQIVSTSPLFAITTPLKVPKHLQSGPPLLSDSSSTMLDKKLPMKGIPLVQSSATHSTSSTKATPDNNAHLKNTHNKEKQNSTINQPPVIEQSTQKSLINKKTKVSSEQLQTSRAITSDNVDSSNKLDNKSKVSDKLSQTVSNNPLINKKINKTVDGNKAVESINRQLTQALPQKLDKHIATQLLTNKIEVETSIAKGLPKKTRSTLNTLANPTEQKSSANKNTENNQIVQTTPRLFKVAIKNNYVPTETIEKRLIKPFIEELNLKSAEKKLPELSSEQINKLTGFKDNKSPDLTRLVHQAFARMIDEKQHSAKQIVSELNLSRNDPQATQPQMSQSLPSQNLLNSPIQNAGLLNNVEKLLFTFLAASKFNQNEQVNNKHIEAQFVELLKTLQPNFKAQNISQLQQQLPSLNSPLMNDLVQLNNSLQQNVSQPVSQTQSQSSDVQLLISLFLPTKLPDDCKQTHLQIGNYKKPAKGNLPEKTVWYIRLNFDYALTGKLSVQAELMDKSVECHITGNSAQVCALAEPHLDTLRRKLSAHGLQVGDIELIEDATKAERFFNQHAIVNIQV